MPVIQRLTVCLLALLLLAPSLALAADQDVRFISIAEIEVKEANAKGEIVLVRKSAEMVQPGQIVLYTNTFTNIGTQAKEKLIVTNPIPANTEYLGGSASETGAEVTFSVDGGKSYAKPGTLNITDSRGWKRPAEPKDYTHIRWQMQAPLKPGATGAVEFRVRVK